MNYGIRLAVAAIVLLLFGAPQTATLNADIYHGTFHGTTVDFVDVTESSLTVEPLYGAPTVSGNVLTFRPGSMAVQAVDCEASFLQGHLTMTLTAQPGFLLDAIDFSALGNYFLSGAPTTASLTSAIFVDTGSSVHITTLSSINSGSSGGPQVGTYNDGTLIDIEDTQSVTLMIDQHLFASAGPLQAAFAQFDQIQIGVFTTAIPEPTLLTGPLLIAGVVLAGRRRRRINRKK